MKTETERTERGAAEDIARMAAQAFKGHVIIQLGPNEWRCAAPGTGIDAFHVICRPGTIVVYGDIGDWILNAYGRSGEELRNWIPAGVRSPEYLFSKVQAAGRDGRECFYWLDAKEEIERRAGEWDEENPRESADSDGEVIDLTENPYRQVLADISDDPYEGHPTYATLHEAWLEAGLCDLEEMGIGVTPRTFWLLEALRLFDRLERAASDPAPREAASPAPAGGGV